MKTSFPFIKHRIGSALAAMILLLGIRCSGMMEGYNDRNLPLVPPLFRSNVTVNPPIITPYLWIANSQSDTVAQVDVSTGRVLRQIDLSSYKQNPTMANPSRTAVDYHFNCWVALRGDYSSTPERVLKIDAATGAVTPGPLVGSALRGIAINADGNIWVGGYNPDSASGGIQRMLVDSHSLAPIYTTTSDMVGSYGMAIGPRPYNKLFSNAAGWGAVLRINASTGILEQRWNFNIASIGGGMIYGIASDLEGNVWNTIWVTPFIVGHYGNYQCPAGAAECMRDFVDGVVALVDVRDVVALAGGSTNIGGRGVCVDRDGNIWAAFNDNNDPAMFTSYVVKIDKMSKTAVTAVRVGGRTVGVTADESGYIWAVNQYGGGPNQVDAYPCPNGTMSDTYNGTVTRINMLTYDTQTFPTCGNYPYTYSDMAGFALRGIVMHNASDPGGTTEAPAGVFAINNNLAYSFTEHVTLNMSVTNATEMQFSNDSGATWSDWEPYGDAKAWTLTPVNGTKTVLGHFRNAVGTYIEISDSIILRSETPLHASDGAADDLLGNAVAVSGNGNTIAAVGGGKLYIYSRNGSAWDEAIIESADAVPFSDSVSISGDGSRVIVGAEDDSSNGTNIGSAYVYEWIDPNWIETKIVPTVETAWNGFGSSVAISPEGNILVIGAELDDVGGNVDQGSAFVFSWDGGAPAEISRIIAADGDRYDNFGCSVSISSGGLFATVAVGAKNDDDMGLNAGAVYVYGYNGVNFDETKLTTAFGHFGDRFGTSVAVSSDGSSVGAGAPYANYERGYACGFARAVSSWNEKQFTASDGASGDRYGSSLSYSSDGKTIVIGAPNNNTERGSVYLYNSADYFWSENQFISSQDEAGALFGSSVSISSNGVVIVVSAPNSDVSPNNNQGLVYIY